MSVERLANAEAVIVFKENLSQFNANCDALRNIERNLSMAANDTLKAAQGSSGRVIQTDDGTTWQHGVASRRPAGRRKSVLNQFQL